MQDNEAVLPTDFSMPRTLPRRPTRFEHQRTPDVRRPAAREVMSALVIVLAVGHATARPHTVEDFEGAANSWTIASSDCRPQVEIHRRTGRYARSGNRCEHVRIRAGSGTYVYATHAIPSAVVIAELRPALWVRSERRGLQLMARVVLPRSKDPRSGRALTALIRGTAYENAGSWQRLHIDDPQALLDRHVPVLRAQFGSQVDAREAYMDLLVLNIYGGLGVTNTWIDDLELENRVPGPEMPAAEADAGSGNRPPQPALRETQLPPDVTNRVEFRRSELTVDGRPFFPQVIEYQGEPFSWLARLGFNTVHLKALPTPAQREEARELGLWLVPPAVPQQGAHASQQQILAWDLGQGLGLRDLQAVQALSEQVRRESDANRPLLCRPDAGLHAYGRYADILLHERLPLGTSLDLPGFHAWLLQRARLARPGTPFWATVQTEPSAPMAEQLKVHDPSVASVLFVEPEQPRILALLAIAAGARGLYFQSRTPLDNGTAQARIRALTLERVNHELSLIKPWIAGGADVSYVDSNTPQVVAAALVTQRSQLIVPIRLEPATQYVSGTSSNAPVVLTVPGVPESSRAFELTTTRLKPLPQSRVAGGTQIILENVAPASLIVLTQDPLVIQGVSRQAASSAERQMRVRRDLAANMLAAVEQTETRLRSVGPAETRVDAFLQQARASFRQCDRFLAARDHSTADHYGKNCLDSLGGLRRLRWEQAVSGLASPASTPFCGQYASLPWHWQLMRQVDASASTPNLLPAGDFEDLDQMLQAGWRHFQDDLEGVRTDVSLSSREPQAGRFALRLRVENQDVRQSARMLETTPVWVNSAPMNVPAGQWVRIHGWVRVDQPVSRSLDHFLVFDSSGGPPLAQRIGTTQGWQEITLYRAVTTPAPFVVTFALTGVGDVSVDSFSVQPVGNARWSGLSARSPNGNGRD